MLFQRAILEKHSERISRFLAWHETAAPPISTSQTSINELKHQDGLDEQYLQS